MKAAAAGINCSINEHRPHPAGCRVRKSKARLAHSMCILYLVSLGTFKLEV